MTSVILCGPISGVPAKEWQASISVGFCAVDRGATSVLGLADCPNLSFPMLVGGYTYG